MQIEVFMKKILKAISLGILVLTILCTLCSCASPNKNPDKAREKLINKGYSVEDVDFSPFVREGKTDAAIIAVKYGKGEKQDIVSAESKIIIYYLKTAEYADEMEKVLIEENAQFKQRYIEAEKEYDIIIGRIGNIVWTGTKQAVKDCR